MQATHENGMVGVTGPTRFMRIVTYLCAFLMAVNGFNGHVQVRYPRLFQSRSVSLEQGAALPFLQRGRIALLKSPPQTVLTDNLGHPQALRVDSIST
jgi:hypothetical protein